MPSSIQGDSNLHLSQMQAVVLTRDYKPPVTIQKSLHAGLLPPNDIIPFIASQ
ncbi:hypothetical protein FRC07_014984, partial [Ceratobasidium sp. 392]